MAATAQVKAPKFGDKIAPSVKLIPRDRMRVLSDEIGFPLSVVLEDDQTIDDGVQDVTRWQSIGPYLHMYQWLRVTNDIGSMVRFMEVERIHGAPGSGLRALTLRDLWPPRIIDKAAEPIASTGDWYIRHGGAHRKWMVIMPNGNVRLDGINTEAEARSICHRESGNPKPIGA